MGENKIKKFRLKKNYTQQYVAEKVGCTRSYFSKIERGEANPTIEMLNQIAAVFGTTVKNLL